MKKKKIILIMGMILLAGFAAYLIGATHEARKLGALQVELLLNVQRPNKQTVDFEDLSDLPPPVLRYFHHVLKDGQSLIRLATIHQTGVLRRDLERDTWSSFRAREFVVVPATGFIWEARVKGPAGTFVRVLDAYAGGQGSGRVSLLNAFCLASETNSTELSEGALHRYLAEAVWFPTALLPQSGVVWTPVDAHNARASLSHEGITVSVDFRFNAHGEIERVYSDGRYRRTDQGYQRTPWEGTFRDYAEQAGMRIPMYGEVGWWVDHALQLVWKGTIEHIELNLSTP